MVNITNVAYATNVVHPIAVTDEHPRKGGAIMPAKKRKTTKKKAAPKRKKATKKKATKKKATRKKKA